jgi:hypothetical protein
MFQQCARLASRKTLVSCSVTVPSALDYILHKAVSILQGVGLCQNTLVLLLALYVFVFNGRCNTYFGAASRTGGEHSCNTEETFISGEETVRRKVRKLDWRDNKIEKRGSERRGRQNVIFLLSWFECSKWNQEEILHVRGNFWCTMQSHICEYLRQRTYFECKKRFAEVPKCDTKRWEGRADWKCRVRMPSGNLVERNEQFLFFLFVWLFIE